MIVGVTDNMGAEYKFQLYRDWILRLDPSVECKKLSYTLDNLSDLNQCDGVVMTGGGDVDPALYGGNIQHPTLYGVDRKRDDFERRVIDESLQKEIPFLGICRGLQIANVHFGGTLIQDLAEISHLNHSTKADVEPRHDVKIVAGSELAIYAGTCEGNVNSFHHQASAIPGTGLKVVAKSEDGIVEAMEFEHKHSHRFFLLIQWHPERMKDDDNPLNSNLGRNFLSEAHIHSTDIDHKR